MPKKYYIKFFSTAESPRYYFFFERVVCSPHFIGTYVKEMTCMHIPRVVLASCQSLWYKIRYKMRIFFLNFNRYSELLHIIKTLFIWKLNVNFIDKPSSNRMCVMVIEPLWLVFVNTIIFMFNI